MSYLKHDINSPLSDYTMKLLQMYMSFPDDQPITAVDFRCRDGKLLAKLTEKHKGAKFLYGVDTHAYSLEVAQEQNGFHRTFQSSYKAEGKMSKDAFSLAIVDPIIRDIMVDELFNSVDQFIEPDYEARVRSQDQFKNEQIDFGDEGMTEAEVTMRKLEIEKKVQEGIKLARQAHRAAIRAQEKKFSFNRDDQFLLARATERLMPGGILVMITPKEMIDQYVTLKLANQYEDIQIIRLDDDEYLEQRKCIILAKKLRKNANDKNKGILLAETKMKSYKDINIIEPQVQASYHVPSQRLEAIDRFRIGPITAVEALQMANRSTLLDYYQDNFSQIMTTEEPVAPAPLKKGHIMLLLTSGYLNGYIGEGPNKHLVKGSATKLSREEEEVDEEGNTTWKEKEFYNISVKYLTRDGLFHKLM